VTKKTGLWVVGLLGIVAVAIGATYYWLEIKPAQDFRTGLIDRGFAYNQMDESASGTMVIASATIDIGGSEDPASLINISFAKTREGYAQGLQKLDRIKQSLASLAEQGVRISHYDYNNETMQDVRLAISSEHARPLEQFRFEQKGQAYDLASEHKINLAQLKEMLLALELRGVTYDQVVSTDETITLVNAMLDVGGLEPVALANAYFQKAPTGYDLMLEQMEFPLGFGDVKLTLPRVEIKAWEFADKIDETENGLQTAAYLSPFLHDKAASIRLEDSRVDGQFQIGSIGISFLLTIGETSLEGVNKGKITSYQDRDIGFVINLDSKGEKEILQYLPGFVSGELVSAKLARSKMQDYDLKRFLELIFLATDDPDAPFEPIYNAMEIEDYQISQFDGAYTQYNKIRSSAFALRGLKKAPAEIVWGFVSMADLFSAQRDWENDPRLPTAIDDFFSIFAMFGEYESFVEGISQTQIIPELGQMPIKVDVARTEMHLKPDTFDVRYHDMKITTDIVDISMGKIALEDFAHRRLLDKLHSLFKTLIEKQGEIGHKAAALSEEELIRHILGLIPRLGEFSIENFHLSGSENSPLKNMIGEWRFGRIALGNKHGFDQAIIPTSVEFEMKDLAFPMQFFDLASANVQDQMAEPLSCLLEDKEFFTFSLHLKADWDRQTQSLSFSENYYQNNLTGLLSLSAQLGNVPETLFSLNPMMREEDYQRISLRNLKLYYDPEGSDTAIVDCASKEMGVTAEALRSLAMMGVRMAVLPDEEIEAQIKPLREVLVDFIRDSGKLEFSLTAKDETGVPLNLLEHVGLSLNPFDFFDISFSRQP